MAQEEMGKGLSRKGKEERKKDTNKNQGEEEDKVSSRSSQCERAFPHLH